MASPGSSWAPQTIGALREIGVAPHGVPCYVDEGTHVGLDGKPFWYASALVVYDMGPNWTRMDLHDPQAVKPAQKKVSAIAERLRREEGGGLISIFYHPCEWVHREFWDGVNFRRGANPPRAQWKMPPQRSEQETEAAFHRFAAYIDHIRSIPGVRFVAAGDLPVIYPDRTRTQGAGAGDVSELAKRLLSGAAAGADFQVIGDRAYSLADQFELLTLAVNELIEGKTIHWRLPATGILGPDSPPPSLGRGTALNWPAFRDAARDVLDFIKTQRRVPSRVFVGADAAAPADFLVAMASAYEFYDKNGRLPMQESVKLGQSVSVLPARHIAQDTPDLFGGWVIHKEGFRAPWIMEMARLQAWTLKPALRK